MNTERIFGFQNDVNGELRLTKSVNPLKLPIQLIQ